MLLRRDVGTSWGNYIYKNMHMYKTMTVLLITVYSYTQIKYTSDQRERTRNSQKMEEDSDAPRAGLLIDWVAVGV